MTDDFFAKHRSVRYGLIPYLLGSVPTDGALLVFNCHNSGSWIAQARKLGMRAQTVDAPQGGKDLYIYRGA